MNKFVGLLLAAALAGVAYMNRAHLPGLGGGKEGVSANAPANAAGPGVSVVEAPSGSSAPVAHPSQHPAKEAMAEAMRLYPGITVAGSPLNKRFVAAHNEAVTGDPDLLARPDWPIILAERAMISLGGSPLARSTPAPTHSKPKVLPGSSLDAKPTK